LRFVDSNVFIYHMAQDPRYGETASRILRRIEEGEETATSTLVVAQVCGYLRWKGRSDIIPLYIDFLRSIPNLMKMETTLDDFLEAEEICRSHSIGWRMWDDAVITAQMRRIGVDEIYSNDGDFDSIPGVKRLFK